MGSWAEANPIKGGLRGVEIFASATIRWINSSILFPRASGLLMVKSFKIEI
jgi:hypothetical protein